MGRIETVWVVRGDGYAVINKSDLLSTHVIFSQEPEELGSDISELTEYLNSLPWQSIRSLAQAYDVEKPESDPWMFVIPVLVDIFLEDQVTVAILKEADFHV